MSLAVFDPYLKDLDPARPVLIAGPTASGKSALALAIAQAQGGVVINADASQVYGCWRVITARPTPEEEARAHHALYGHVGFDQEYSVGHWLREVTPLLQGPERPIIVGGTGLYFHALTQGLSDIPPTPPNIRAAADMRDLPTLIADLDAATLARIDVLNRARVQRAWEVRQATGRGLAAWQDATPPPVLPMDQAQGFAMDAPKAWLTPRIEARFDLMLAEGALEEVAAYADRFDPALPACRAIGVPELMAVHTGALTLNEARTKATVATRQYAKRQRTWQRANCADWIKVACAG